MVYTDYVYDEDLDEDLMTTSYGPVGAIAAYTVGDRVTSYVMSTSIL